MKLKRFQKENLSIIVMVVIFGFVVWWFLFNTILLFPKINQDQFSAMPKPERGQKIMIFSPHPDDETIAAGGYIYTAENAGAEVRIVLVTDGNRRGLKLFRRSEFMAATKDLEVPRSDLVFLNYKDGSMATQDWDQVRQNFENKINDFKPDIIIAPYSYDAHPDHAVTGMVVENIAFREKIPVYQYLVHFKNFPNHSTYTPWIYLIPPKSLLTGDWNNLVLSKQAEAAKAKAISSYKTQLVYPPLADLLMGMIKKNEIFYKPF